MRRPTQWKASGTVEEAKLATEKLAAKLAPFEVNILPELVFHDTWNQNVLMYVEDGHHRQCNERPGETNSTFYGHHVGMIMFQTENARAGGPQHAAFT